MCWAADDEGRGWRGGWEGGGGGGGVEGGGGGGGGDDCTKFAATE